MNHLIKEATEIESRNFGRWNADDEERLDAIWKELKKPYLHLYKYSVSDVVGAGWWEDLLAAYEAVSGIMADYPDHRFVIKQVKEKFGAIRFYYEVIGPEDLPAEEQPTGEVFERLRAVTKSLEEASVSKCEICGQPGHRRGNGWIKTLCDAHAAVQKAQYQKRAG